MLKPDSIIVLYQHKNEVIKWITFCVNANPIEVPGQFLRNVSLASRREADHGDDVGTVDIVGALTCTNTKTLLTSLKQINQMNKLVVTLQSPTLNLKP